MCDQAGLKLHVHSWPRFEEPQMLSPLDMHVVSGIYVQKE
jgi:hypothetical protein